MVAAKCSDEEFLATVKTHGIMKAAKIIGKQFATSIIAVAVSKLSMMNQSTLQHSHI